MSRKPRSEVIIENEIGVYYCWNRLVRGERLLGFDPLSGKYPLNRWRSLDWRDGV